MTSATTSNTAATNNTSSASTNTNRTPSSSSASRPPSSSSTSSQSAAAAAAANSACAACKYQRRKCIPNCTLAPYFPANQQQKFVNAHRLFGLRNILRIIRSLDPYQRNEAMNTIIFQSDMRAHDPVGGCHRYIRDLERQLERDSAELALVLRHLAACRAQAAASQTITTAAVAPDLEINPTLLLNATTEDDVAAETAIYDANLFPPMSQPQDQQQYYNYFCFDGSGASRDQSNDPNASINSGSINNSLLSLQQQQQQCLVEDEDDEVKPLVDMFEVKQALIGEDGEDEGDSRNNTTTTEVGSIHPSTNLELKDDPHQVEHVQEQDLISAASLFTLTNGSSSAL